MFRELGLLIRNFFLQFWTPPANVEAPKTSLDQFQVGGLLKIVPNLETLEIVQIWKTRAKSGWEWTEYVLSDSNGDPAGYLCVEFDDGVWFAEFSQRNITREVNFDPKRNTQAIFFEGKSFHMDEVNAAQSQSISSQGVSEWLPVTVYDFSHDKEVISVEDWGDTKEVWLGKKIKPSMVEYQGVPSTFTH